MSRAIDADRLKTVLSRNVSGIFGVDGLALLIDVQPTIATVKNGKWLETREDYLLKYHCSNCGHIAYFDCDDERYVRFNYCPYCGAKMK